jgi:L-amino acid N-acyltransferase YncA
VTICRHRDHHTQPLSPDALLELLIDSKDEVTWKYALAQRFSCPDECVAEVFNPHRPGGAYCCTDRYGSRLGWAVYFRFHERAGYDGSMKLVLHSDETSSCPSTFDSLATACAREGTKQGVHTMISLIDSKMSAHIDWYCASPFVLGGRVTASANSTLNVFYRKLL